MLKYLCYYVFVIQDFLYISRNTSISLENNHRKFIDLPLGGRPYFRSQTLSVYGPRRNIYQFAVLKIWKDSKRKATCFPRIFLYQVIDFPFYVLSNFFLITLLIPYSSFELILIQINKSFLIVLLIYLYISLFKHLLAIVNGIYTIGDA